MLIYIYTQNSSNIFNTYFVDVGEKIINQVQNVNKMTKAVNITQNYTENDNYIIKIKL